MEHIKHWIDVLSFGAMIATLIDQLPHATALLSFIWICIRLYETRTVQRWLRKS